MKKAVHCFLLTLYISKITNCQNCDNRLLDVKGVVSSVSKPFCTLIGPQYSSEREVLGINVSVNCVVGIGATAFTQGLLPQIGYNGTPTVYMITNSDQKTDPDELRFPIYGTAVVIIFNIPKVDSLNLTIKDVADIYKGIITKWNHPRIAMHNPNAMLPNRTILPLARLDQEASTGLLTQVFSANDAEWSEKYKSFFDPGFNCSRCQSPSDVQQECCDTTTWPKGVIYEYVTQVVGMVGTVMSIPFTIGYASYSTVADYTVNRASILTKSDHNTAVNCTTLTVQKAMMYYVNKSDPNNLLLNITSIGMPEDAYPFTAFAYMSLNRTYRYVDCCFVREIVGFLNFVLFEWDDSQLSALNIVPVLAELKERIRKYVIETVTCNNELSYGLYVQSKILQTSNRLESWVIVLIVAVLFFALTLTGCYFYYMFYKRNQADENRWIVDSKRIKILQKKKGVDFSQSKLEELKSIESKSLADRSMNHSSSLKWSSSVHGPVTNLKTLMVTAEFDQNNVFLDRIECRYPQQWKTSSKRLMSRMKNLLNKNIGTMLGVTVIDREVMTIFDFCSKGTLHYILRTAKYNINEPIKYQFAVDIAQGMKFLHQNHIVHGHLSSLTCYLDSSWTVKISQWHQLPLYVEENPTAAYKLFTYNRDLVLEEEDLIKLLYVDYKIQLERVHEFSDVFSFGLLLIEIFTKKLPYMMEIEEGLLSYKEIFEKKFIHNTIVYPKLLRIPARINALSNICIGLQNHRPTFAKILSDIKSMTKISSGIVDIIMDTLESHAEKLEEKVEERTAELKEMTERMRLLLNEVLPPQIATKLFNGLPVPPESFECISIYFSDIVGFTTLSAMSTPIEVMTLLNDLWLAFDDVIDKYDVYKVDTIGDAYMVCSGLPNRNGSEHCRQIALVSLDLLHKCKNFKIVHLPNEQLKIRIGINTGPVTAGVVGSKMPQYCVFGDTVNTAARMESTSEAQKIQITDITYQFLSKNFPDLFEISYRGETSVKGKGMMSTYWLLGRKN